MHTDVAQRTQQTLHDLVFVHWQSLPVVPVYVWLSLAHSKGLAHRQKPLAGGQSMADSKQVSPKQSSSSQLIHGFLGSRLSNLMSLTGNAKQNVCMHAFRLAKHGCC